MSNNDVIMTYLCCNNNVIICNNEIVADIRQSGIRFATLNEDVMVFAGPVLDHCRSLCSVRWQQGRWAPWACMASQPGTGWQVRDLELGMADQT